MAIAVSTSPKVEYCWGWTADLDRFARFFRSSDPKSTASFATRSKRSGQIQSSSGYDSGLWDRLRWRMGRQADRGRWSGQFVQLGVFG